MSQTLNAAIKDPSVQDLLVASDQIQDAQRCALAAESTTDALALGLQSIGNLLVIAADSDERRIGATDLMGLGHLVNTIGSLLAGAAFLRSEAEHYLAEGVSTYAELASKEAGSSLAGVEQARPDDTEALVEALVARLTTKRGD